MRDKGSDARWRAIVDEWSKSGESVRDFCAKRELSRWTFYDRRRSLRPEVESSKPAFLPVRVVGRASVPPIVVSERARSSGVEVVLRSGDRLRLDLSFDSEALTRAVAALEAARC